MISVIISTISVVIIVIVTIAVINKTYSDESNRKTELRGIVDQINSVNLSSQDVEVKQNATIESVTKRLMDVGNDVDVVKANYVAKSNMEREVKSTTGTFDSMSVHGMKFAGTGDNLLIQSSNGSTLFGVSGGGSNGGTMQFGSNLTLSQNAAGDSVFLAGGSNASMRFQNSSNAGFILQNNKVGIGAAPAYGTLDVTGSIWASDGLVGVVGGQPVNIMSHDANYMYLNKDNRLPKGVSVTSDLTVNSNIVFSKWMMHSSNTSMFMTPAAASNTWNTSKRMEFDSTGYINAYGGGLNIRGGKSVYNPTNLPTMFPGSNDNSNYIRGDTIVQGNMSLHGTVQMARGDPGPMIERSYGSDNNRYGVGQFPNGTLRMYSGNGFAGSTINLSLAKTGGQFDDVVKIKANKDVEISGPIKAFQGLTTTRANTDDTYQKNALFENTAQNHKWTVFNNNDKSLVFSPTDLNSTVNPYTGTGVMSVTQTGDLTTTGGVFSNGKLIGSMVISSGNVYGNQVCAGTNASAAVCLTASEISQLKQNLALANSGVTAPTPTPTPPRLDLPPSLVAIP